jgi:hypothetical protein
LYRETSLNQQVVLPWKLRPTIFKELHEDMGHLGAERVLDLAKAFTLADMADLALTNALDAISFV